MERLLAGFPVQIEQTPNRGRILVATKDIEPGNLVLASTAYAFCPSIDSSPGVCASCGEIISKKLAKNAFPYQKSAGWSLAAAPPSPSIPANDLSHEILVKRLSDLNLPLLDDSHLQSHQHKEETKEEEEEEEWEDNLFGNLSSSSSPPSSPLFETFCLSTTPPLSPKIPNIVETKKIDKVEHSVNVNQDTHIESPRGVQTKEEEKERIEKKSNREELKRKKGNCSRRKQRGEQDKEKLHIGYSKGNYEDIFSFFDDSRSYSFLEAFCSNCLTQPFESYQMISKMTWALYPTLQTIWSRKWGGTFVDGDDFPLQLIMEDEVLMMAQIICACAVEKFKKKAPSHFKTCPSFPHPFSSSYSNCPSNSQHDQSSSLSTLTPSILTIKPEDPIFLDVKELCFDPSVLQKPLAKAYSFCASIIRKALEDLAMTSKGCSKKAGECSCPGHLAQMVELEFQEDLIEQIFDRMQNNSFGWWNHTKSFMLASSLNPAASMVNHSCLPNIARCPGPPSAIMTFWALYPIKAGEEVTISYFGFSSSSVEERSAYLEYTYGFSCSCPRCTVSRASLSPESEPSGEKEKEKGEKEKEKGEEGTERSKGNLEQEMDQLFGSLSCKNCGNFLVPSQDPSLPTESQKQERRCRWCGSVVSKRQHNRILRLSQQVREGLKKY